MIIKPEWIAAAQAAMAKWRVPASVTLAQFGIESAWGAKAPGNNPFGIKALKGQPTQLIHTHEFIHGKMVPEDLEFAKFDSLAAAFDAHARLIATAPVYAPAMAALPDLYRFISLMAAHYATAPDYAHSIAAVIQGDALTRYDVVPK
jgi:flagellum-specific peptidoglycan hydrolase FlgJ